MDKLERKWEEAKVFLRSIISNNAERVEITAFPFVWHKMFPDKKDLVCGVDLGENAKAIMCVYKTPEESDFIEHVHSCEENIMVIEGEVEVVLNVKLINEESITLKKGDSLKIDSHVSHLARFKAGTFISVTWLVHEGESLTFDFERDKTP